MLKEFEWQVAEIPEIVSGEESDEEIDGKAYVDYLGVLADMWDAVGKPLDERRLNKYMAELRDIPLGLLQKAVSRALRNAGDYHVVPTIGAIYAAVRKELGNPQDLDEAVDRWCAAKFERSIVRFG